jgi:type IV pilus assembly protein PilA
MSNLIVKERQTFLFFNNLSTAGDYWHSACLSPNTGMGRCSNRVSFLKLQELLMLKQVQKGFTLIELMIVIAIIGILAAIAIPAYQNYTIRAQVTEGLTLADGWKTAIAEYYANTGNMPAAIANLAGTSTSTGKYEASILVSGGAIVITYGGSANAKITGAGSNTLSLQPYINANNDVLWRCGLAALPASASATSAGTTAVSTNVSPQYLPTACHV